MAAKPLFGELLMDVPPLIGLLWVLVVFLSFARTIYDLLFTAGVICTLLAVLFNAADFLSSSMVFLGGIYIGFAAVDTLVDRTHMRLDSQSLAWLLGNPLLTCRQKIVRANMFAVFEGCIAVAIGLACEFFPDTVAALLRGRCGAVPEPRFGDSLMRAPALTGISLLLVGLLASARTVYDLLFTLGLVCMTVAAVLNDQPSIMNSLSLSMFLVGGAYIGFGVVDSLKDETRVNLENRSFHWLLGNPRLTRTQKRFRANMFEVLLGCAAVSVGLACLFFPDDMTAILSWKPPPSIVP